MSIIDKLDDLSISVRSPGNAVTATYGIDKGMSVSMVQQSIKSHTENSLADEINAAIKGVRRGFGIAVSQLFAAAGFDEVSGAEPDSDVSSKKRSFQGRVREFETTVVSPRGYVKAAVSGDGDVEVRIRPGTAGRVDATSELICAEVNAAVAEALGRQGSQVAKAHEEVY